jgi:outer membrane protein TolC
MILRVSRRVAVLVLLLASLPGLVRSAPAAESLPLAEEIFPQLRPILQGAVERSPSMIARGIETAQADALRIMSRAGLLPNVAGGFSYSVNSSAVAEAASSKSRSDGIFYNFGLNQPVFHWGSVKATADSARIGHEIAQRNFAEAYRTLVLSLRSQFLSLVVRRQQLENARHGLRTAEAALALTEEKLRIGQISAGEAINPRLAVDEAALAVDRTAAEYEAAKRYFCQFAGLDDLPDDQVPASFDLGAAYYDPHRPGPLLARFEQSGGAGETLQARNLQATIEQADLNYRIAKYRLFPKFSLGAGYVQSNTTNVIGSSVVQSAVQSQSVSLSASWSIFDGFATRGAKLSALASRRSAERQLANYLQATEGQVRDLARSIGFAARAMRLADTRRELALAAVKTAAEDLRRGVGSQATLDAAQSTLRAVEMTALMSRVEFLNRWSDFASTAGFDPALALVPSSPASHARR